MTRNLIDQSKSEIKQLPLLLVKLFGGIMASIGFPAVVVLATRRANPSLVDIVPYFVLGVLGVVIFAVSSRALAKRTSGNIGQTLASKDKMRMSIITWAILLMLVAIFLLYTLIVTR